MLRIRDQLLRRTLQTAPLAPTLSPAAGKNRLSTLQIRTEINQFFVMSGDTGGHSTGPHHVGLRTLSC